VQEAGGTLAVRLPQTIAASFGPPQEAAFSSGLGPWSQAGEVLRLPGGGRFTCASGGPLPATCLLRATFHIQGGTQACGFMLRTGADFETGYYVRLEPHRQRLVFDAWPRGGDVPHMVELERPLAISAARPLELVLYVNGSICEVYIDDRVAMSARMYDHAVGEWGLFVQDGTVEATGVTIRRWQNED
jgi:beta-fructofuranosidase